MFSFVAKFIAFILICSIGGCLYLGHSLGVVSLGSIGEEETKSKQEFPEEKVSISCLEIETREVVLDGGL